VEFRTYNDSGDPVGDALAQQFNIQYVPSFLFVNADGSPSGELLVGDTTEAALKARIEALK
jgi:protein-disulfide isomerase